MMMAVTRVAFPSLLVCLALAAPARGQIYQWTDENGVVHFSSSGVPAEHAQDAKVLREGRETRISGRADMGGDIPLVTLGGDRSQRFVKVELEGRASSREVLMLVDTGAQMTMIDPETADELEIELIRQVPIMGATGTGHVWIGRLQRLRLGDDTMHDLEVMVGPQPGLRLLGMNVLSALDLTVGPDYLEKR